MNKKKLAGGAIINFSKAFDTVDYIILLQKQEHMELVAAIGVHYQIRVTDNKEISA